MHILTALDIAGIKFSSLGGDRWLHTSLCPWCGEEAWMSHDYFQCYNPSCTTQAASPEDIVAHAAGGYPQAAQVISRRLGHMPDDRAMQRRAMERRVLDLWMEFCVSPATSESTILANRYSAMGLGVRHSRFNALVLDKKQMAKLVELAVETGADLPDSWADTPPPASLCFCIQSLPHTIDRIVVLRRGNRTQEIVWNRYAAGFCGLLGLSPRQPRLLVADANLALRLQHDLAGRGELEEVCSVYKDEFYGSTCPPWRVTTHLLTAAPRSPEVNSNELLFSTTDLSNIQYAMDHFKGVTQSMRAIPMEHVTEMRPRNRHFSWSQMRWAGIVTLIGEHDTQMPPTAQAIFEKTGTKSEDAVRMIAHFQKLGRFSLAEDVSRNALTRVIYHDQRVVVKETANAYQLHHQGHVNVLANFSLKVTASVSFDEIGEAYCQATLRCGKAKLDVLFPQNLLHDRVNSLEEELKRQIAARKKTTTAGKLPTVIDTGKFRTYVMKHLKEQVAEAPLVSGIDRLGWSTDRKSFNFPGFTVDINGRHKASEFLCPSIPVLKLFEAVPDWAEVCPDDLDRSCHDIISMLVASCVRYFRRCSTHPITVAQTSDSIQILEKILAGLGQHQMHELNSNARDGGRVTGVFGYPILAVGPRVAAVGSQAPFLHLTDSGYAPPTSPTAEQVEAAARAAQFSLRRVVEWCIATGADDFKEVRSIQHHRSLMREGQWLMQNVCDLQEWEISAPDSTALEKLLEQIPYEEAGRRMTLVDGEELIIDVHDLDRDHDAIIREARGLGTVAAIDNDRLVGSAVKMLPAISNFYGQDPDLTVVSSS